MTSRRLSVFLKNITDIKSDVTVNAANKDLNPGKGIDGAIRRAGSSKLDDEISFIKEQLPNKQLEGAETIRTSPHDFTNCNEFIIHLAGPDIRYKLSNKKKHNRLDEQHLRMCYANVMTICDSERVQSVAIPFLSIGIYKYPMEEGVAIALQSIIGYFEAHKNSDLPDVSFVTLDQSVYNLARNMLNLNNGDTLELDSENWFEIRKRIETVPAKQCGVMPLTGSLKVASFLKKWTDKKEERTAIEMKTGADALRHMNAAYMKLYRNEHPEKSQDDAERKQHMRLINRKDGKKQDASRKQTERQRNPELVTEENIKRKNLRMMAGDDAKKQDASRKKTDRQENTERASSENLKRRHLRIIAGDDGKKQDASRKNRMRQGAMRKHLIMLAGEKGKQQVASRKQSARQGNPELVSSENLRRRYLRRQKGDIGRINDSQRKRIIRRSSPNRTHENYQQQLRRRKPEFNHRRSLIRKIRSKIDKNETKGLPTFLIKTTDGNLKLRQIGEKCFKVREGVSFPKVVKRSLLTMFSKRYDTLYRQKLQNTMSSNERSIREAAHLAETCWIERNAKKDAANRILKKYGIKKRICVNVCNRAGKFAMEQQQAILECNTLYFTTVALSDVAQKRLNRVKTRLAGYANARADANLKFASDKEKCVFEMGGGHLHVKTHEQTGADIYNDYQLVEDLYPEFVECMKKHSRDNQIPSTDNSTAIQGLGSGKNTQEESPIKLCRLSESESDGELSSNPDQNELFQTQFHGRTNSLNYVEDDNAAEMCAEDMDILDETLQEFMDFAEEHPKYRNVGLFQSQSSDYTKESIEFQQSEMVDVEANMLPDILDEQPEQSEFENHVEEIVEEIFYSMRDHTTGYEPYSPRSEDTRLNVLGVLDDTPTFNSFYRDQSQFSENGKGTYVRMGDVTCEAEDVMHTNWPIILRKLIGGLEQLEENKQIYDYVQSHSKCDKCDSGKECHISTCDSKLRLLRELSPHFRTVRLILRCWYALRQHARWLTEFEEIHTRRPSYAQYLNIIDADKLSHEMRSVKAKLALGQTDESHHTEEAIKERFGKQIGEFQKTIGMLETNKCECCLRLFKKDQVRYVKCSDPRLPQFLHHPAGAPDILICKNDCLKQIKKGKLPDLCIANGLDLDEIPDELKGLNWLELTLIRQVRPLMTTFQLTNARGATYGTHKAYKGTVLHIPMPLEETWNHVLQKLPSTAGVIMRILVENNRGIFREQLVNTEKVFKALEWLVKENPFYRDIVLVDKQEFEKELNDSGLPPAYDEFDDEHLLTQLDVDTTVTSATNVNPQPPKGQTTEILMKLKRMKGEPIFSSEKHLEERCFPEIFPKGKGAMHSVRQHNVTGTRYIRRNLRLSDRRFINDNYAVVMNNMKDIKTILNSININAKKKMKNSDFAEKLNSNELDSELSTVFRALRSHNDYWKERRQELKTMIKYFGPPTFFITVNPAENEWSELRATYESVYPHLTGEKLTTHAYCVLDAMIFVRHFAQRTQALYSTMLKGAQGIFGHGIHYWRRTEYQMRGAPHCHGILWIKDAPSLENHSREEIVNYIDRHITCRMPDPKTESTLYERVKKFQDHNCTSTCKSQKKVGGRIRNYCRFGYPMDAQPKTQITEKTGLFDDPLIRKKSYYLLRPLNCRNINAYNAILLLAWNGNVDVQYLGEMSLAHLEYITGYVGKGESKSHLDDFADFTTTMTKKDAIKMAMHVLRMRELGIPEVYDRLLGQHLHDSDCSVEYLNNNDKDNRVRLLKPMDKLKHLADNEPVTEANLYDVYYPKRPEDLKNYSLFTVFTGLKYIRGPPKKKITKKKNKQQNCDLETSDNEVGSERVEEDLVEGIAHIYEDNKASPFYLFPQGSYFFSKEINGHFKARTKPILARFYIEDITTIADDDEAAENYFRRLLFMFKPWRNEDTDLMGNCNSFAEAWAEFWEQSLPMAKSALQKLLRRTQEMYEAAHKRREDEQRRRQLLKDMEVEDVDPECEIEVAPRVVSNESLDENVKQLNADQKDAFDAVIEEVKARETASPDRELENIFISGFAGTGKSKLIHDLADYISFHYGNKSLSSTQPAVLLAAPTGLAAVHIQGNTVHSLVKLGTEHGKMGSYEALRPENRSALAYLFKNVRLLIIDEISMVSNLMLLKLSHRLQEIKANDLPFGGLLLAVFGDLLQLPPVRLPFVFCGVRGYQVRQIFKSIPYSLNIWDMMFKELTINMRQKDDQSYSETLNRIRIGSPTNDDYKRIISRFITTQTLWEEGDPLPRGANLNESVEYYMKLYKKDNQAIAVFSYTAIVTAFNEEVIKKTAKETIVIESRDEAPSRIHKKGTLHRPWLRRGNRRQDLLKSNSDGATSRRKVDDTKKAGGLPKTLVVQKGCRVMLTRNVDIASKLVNGVMGTLVDIKTCNGVPEALIVKFDIIAEPQEIKRQRSIYNVGPEKQAARSQFPLVLAYALTIHKCQGVSVNNVMVDLYDLFCEGQGYVALSRSRKLEGVHVINFHPDSLFASTKAVSEYNRLRSTIGMQNLPEPNIKGSLATVFPKKISKYQEKFLGNEVITVIQKITRKRERVGNTSPKNPQKKRTTTKEATTINDETLNTSSAQHMRTREHQGNTISSNSSKNDKQLHTIKPSLEMFTNGAVENRVRLQNNGQNYCFANSAVQILLRIWGNRFNDFAGLCPIADKILGVKNSSGIKSVAGVLAKAGNEEYKDGRQHDSTQFLSFILDSVKGNYSYECQLQTRKSFRCKRCDLVTTVATTSSPILIVMDDASSTTFNDLVSNSVHTVVTMTKICEQCSPGRNVPHFETTDVTPGIMTTYLLLAMPLFLHNGLQPRQNTRIWKTPENSEYLFGSQWKTIAAIEHQGQTPYAGHYRALIENAGKWYLHNDSQVTEADGLSDHSRFYLYVLQKT